MSPILLIVSGISLSIIVITQGGLEPFNPVVQSIGFSLLAIFFSSLLILSVTQPENNALVHGLSWPPLKKLGTIYQLRVLHLSFSYLVDIV
jgi:hypothetical protein